MTCQNFIFVIEYRIIWNTNKVYNLYKHIQVCVHALIILSTQQIRKKLLLNHTHMNKRVHYKKITLLLPWYWWLGSLSSSRAPQRPLCYPPGSAVWRRSTSRSSGASWTAPDSGRQGWSLTTGSDNPPPETRRKYILDLWNFAHEHCIS